ncbi:hypothetical protein V1525DRAFT_422655 [Lipomyces kononenkoae]|uniref:Uncharacterized protein n=1 Tax=Lipomyces kononenkoae TaxID=34357 RepID=A0ACC3SS96_LIPKO
MTDEQRMDTLNDTAPNVGTTNPTDGTPAWLEQFLQAQQNTVNAQQQQMLQLIQQQGHRIDQVAHLLSQAQNNAPGAVPQPVSADLSPNFTAKRPRAKLPDCQERYAGFGIRHNRPAARVRCTFHIKLTVFRNATRTLDVDLRHPTHGDDHVGGASYHGHRKLSVEERQNIVQLHHMGFSQSNIATFLTAHREEANNFAPVSYMDVANVLNPRDHPRRRIRDYLRTFDDSILTAWHSHAVASIDPAAHEGHEEQIDRLLIVERKYVREVRQRPHVLQIDATYNTNGSDFACVNVVCAGADLEPIPAAVAFLESEDEQSYVWVLERLG